MFFLKFEIIKLIYLKYFNSEKTGYNCTKKQRSAHFCIQCYFIYIIMLVVKQLRLHMQINILRRCDFFFLFFFSQWIPSSVQIENQIAWHKHIFKNIEWIAKTNWIKNWQVKNNNPCNKNPTIHVNWITFIGALRIVKCKMWTWVQSVMMLLRAT